MRHLRQSRILWIRIPNNAAVYRWLGFDFQIASVMQDDGVTSPSHPPYMHATLSSSTLSSPHLTLSPLRHRYLLPSDFIFILLFIASFFFLFSLLPVFILLYSLSLSLHTSPFFVTPCVTLFAISYSRGATLFSLLPYTSISQFHSSFRIRYAWRVITSSPSHPSAIQLQSLASTKSRSASLRFHLAPIPIQSRRRGLRA